MKKIVSVLLALLFLLGMSVPAMAEDVQLPIFSGIVTDLTEESITVVSAYGSTLTFKLDDPELEVPAIGSLVDVAYTGDISTMASVNAITVVNEAKIKSMNGTVSAVETDKLTVKPSKGNTVTVNLIASTTVTGKAKTYKEGDTVTVTYAECTQFMTTVNLAVNVEVTKVKQEKKANDDDSLTNKKLTGVVVALEHGNYISVRTSKGKLWTFKLYSRTAFPSKKTLELGCTVTITYDGYASNRPYAKKVNVTKTKTETERGKTYKKSGTVEFFEGMEIGLTNGFSADVAYAKHSGKGDRVPGRKVTVYYYVSNGRNYATKIKWK